MSNKLKNETSPYLLQHAQNPVYWYPWCDEAFEKAKLENKPIFLSIGYSTCHWCHVMAHESFEDDKTAQILNKYFISIKVDREERPDIDSVYMSVCQAFTGSGGWPMSIFMTWDKKPFFAGTYFPVRSRYGMPGFSELLGTIANQWQSNRAALLGNADKIIGFLKNDSHDQISSDNKDLAAGAIEIFAQSFDKINGGFGGAPKFPTPHNLLFLMLYSCQNGKREILEMVETTLLQMRKGGIFDHIGYGFSRYSTDKYYLAPHFEKMLYDNALLIISYAVAASITKNNIYLDTAKKCAKYILNEMTSSDGGFYSAQDADSEGVEGKYYTFSLSEIIGVLGKEKAEEFAKVFDITSQGNFEGMNIPNLLKSNNLESNFKDEIKKLYDYRKKRYALHLDDKILLSWNCMMISALCMLYRASGDEQYLNMSKNASDFIAKNLSSGRNLYTSYRDGKHSEKAFLDDYAFYIAALIEMFNSTLDKAWLQKAEDFCKEAIRRFSDNENGGFFLCEADSVEFFINPKETYDGAVPSGNSVMAYNLVRLYQLTDNVEYRELAQNQIDYMSSKAQDNPSGHSMFLIANLLFQNPPEHITIALNSLSDLSKIKISLPLLANIKTVKENNEYPLLNHKTTYYICKNHTCLPPTNTPEHIKNVQL